MQISQMLTVPFVLNRTQQPFQLLGLPIQLVFPLNLRNPPTTPRSTRLHYQLLYLAVLLVDLLQVNPHPRTVQKLPKLLTVHHALLDYGQTFWKVIQDFRSRFWRVFDLFFWVNFDFLDGLLDLLIPNGVVLFCDFIHAFVDLLDEVFFDIVELFLGFFIF